MLYAHLSKKHADKICYISNLVNETYSKFFSGQCIEAVILGLLMLSLIHIFTGIESFKGQKIRTMENAYHLQFWKQMGANPTPMSFSEVYIGLQQGTIDAQENAYEIIVSAKLYEQQKYLISTNAVPDYTTLIVSDEFYQGLTKEQQKIIDQAAKTAQEKARESADDRRIQRQKVLEDEGMQIVDCLLYTSRCV